MNNDSIKLISNQPKYFEFIRKLRNNSSVKGGFIDSVHIGRDEQIKYMAKYKNDYKICLLNDKPIGYIGVIDKDIRLAVLPSYQRKGAGFFMIKELLKKKRDLLAKIKISNLASQRLFEKAGFIFSHTDSGCRIYKPGRKVAIIQSAYIPWKGYFDIINSVDEFVILDTVKYNRGYRNRNKIITKQGLRWLTIPVVQNSSAMINEIVIVDPKWARSHLSSIFIGYTQAIHFKKYKDFFLNLYQKAESEQLLTNINELFLREITKLLGIKTTIHRSEDIKHDGMGGERLISICKTLQASEYLSGPSAKTYIDEKLFSDAKIKLSWMDYDGYKEYPQNSETFVHQVSIIDMIFNLGPKANKYLKSF